MNEQVLISKLEDIHTLAMRAEFAANELINDYGFFKAPNPIKALGFARGTDKSEEAKQAFKWIMEYHRIYTLVEIASDYIAKIEKLASNVVDA